MQNRIALNRTIISVWILLINSSVILAVLGNPVVGAVAGIACGVFFAQWQRKAPSPNWTDAPWARLALPLLAVGVSALFVIAIIFAVFIITSIGPPR